VTNRLRDILAGAIFIAIGLAFAIGTRNLDLGTAFRMGPGYFPLVLAGLLMLIGFVIVFQAIREPWIALQMHPAPWRGVVLILAAPVLFGATVRGLGLLPAIAEVALVSSFASRRMSVPLAVAITVILTAFCVLVFSVALGLPIRLIGPWLGA
jgi:hypothetical protein